MKGKKEGMMAGWMRLIPAGLLGWAMIGCDSPPDLQPIAPPGAPVPRKAPDEEPAQAQGEIPPSSRNAPTTTAKASPKPPAPPTAKGEIKTTAGGVKYETLKEGTGPELQFGQTGEFLYEGKLEDGKVFDTTKPENQPRPFAISDKVIEGWQEGLPGMKVGEVRKLTIPPDKGYGAAGHLPEIPPGATLTFEVELVKIAGQ